ncbi:succinate dehydrogenase, cytochrome b556 subunit [Micrococcus sp. FDAARGOS_333]|uniref:succinate dehydrogenase, cytochrome b556 subunit n=1 Tax=Micrococcus sp. FDAARGOS_333 TaxID=1930558 RepID=UPI000B4E1E6A|nr:succinate dehydrogenase, cytochrome b556 subunit [Micrococcus sp. FDAARGOS_333]PNL17430.1 succinate dehydrogenase, cytochrome b556 subunit [Micrococcus sp. FDAARGOS_333]
MTSATAQAPAKNGRGTLYRGYGGMWSWVGHRITGVVIFFYLLVHVLDTSLVRVSPEAYDAVIGSYKNPLFALGEAGLVAAVLFHALNGLRIILVDFWKGGTKHQKTLLWVVLGLWVVLTLGFSVRHLMLAFGGM